MPHQSIFSPGSITGLHSPRQGIRGNIVAVVTLLTVWWERAKQRRALAKLDDRILADIGITREQARKESCTPFWITRSTGND